MVWTIRVPKPTTSRVVQADVLSPANIVACSDGLPFPARSFEVDSRPESTTQLLHFPADSPETCRPTEHAHSLQSPASAIAHLPCCHTSTLPTRADALAPRTLLLRVCTRPAVHQPLHKMIKMVLQDVAPNARLHPASSTSTASQNDQNGTAVVG